MKEIVFNRMELAILTVLIETYPLGLSEEEIFNRIEERGLLKMSDDEFAEYTHQIIESKQN
jgi:hypothetical protein